jgi:predicted aspartyl protease
VAQRFAIKAVLLGLGLLGSSAPSRADDCAPLTQLVAVDLLPGDMPGLRFLVPVTVNGTPRTLMLDTGGGYTSLTPAAADALGLSRHESNGRLLDMTGHASRDYVQIDTLKLGSLSLDGLGPAATHLWITPMPGLGSGGAATSFDGILAGDLMMHYDIDIDFPGRSLKVFSQDHCAGNAVYWPAAAVAVVPFVMADALNPLPGRRMRLPDGQGTHIRVAAMLDGKHFMAVIDTGALHSTISARAARDSFGIGRESPGSRPLGMIDEDAAHQLFLRTFARLELDGVAVLNPRLVVIPDLLGSKDPDNRLVAGSHIRRVDDGLDPQLTIGMDVLRLMHIYIAFHERKLYISLPGAKVAADSAAKTSATQ